MNINAQELTLVRKNMKFGEATTTNPQPTTVTEPPVTKPESGLNALDAQAQNNIAFQGVKLPTAMKQGMSKIMLLAALAGGSLMATSCDDDPYVIEKEPINITNNVSVTVDFSFVQELINQMKADREIDQQQHAEMMAAITNIYTLLADGEISEAEFRKELFLVLARVEFNQERMYAQLIENGKSQEEANAILERIENGQADILARLTAGEITFKEARAEWEALLNSIDGTLKGILAEIQGLRDDINANHADLMATKEEELEFMNKFYEQGENQTALLDSMYNNQKGMAENIQILTNNSNELLAIAQDDTKYNELMNKLDSLKPEEIDYQKFEQMFKLLNMNLQDAIRDFKNDNKKGQQALIGAINNFKNTYLKTESAQSQQFAIIIGKLDFITKYLPNLSQDEVEAAIKELTEAVKNNTGAVEENTEVIGSGLDNIDAKLDAVIAKLDTLIDNTSGLTEFFAAQKDNWINALKNLEKGNQILDRILTEQKITNEYLSGFKADFAEMKDAQKTANSYLNILIKKTDAVEKAIQEIDVNVEVNGGMTRDEFLSAMEERDKKAATEFKKFIEEYGFDKVPGDVQTIKEFLAQVKDAIQSQKDYSAQLDRIIAQGDNIYNFLLNMDFSNPEEIAKLDKIINILENWKHICECDHDNISGDDENKDDETIKDLEDMFS